MNKLGILSNNYNPDKDRKNTLTNILTKTEPRNEDDVIYVENYIKKYFAQGLVEIKSKVDQEQFKKLLYSMKYDVLEKQYLLKEKEMFETNFYFVLSGKIELSAKNTMNKTESILETFESFKTIVLKDSLQKTYNGFSLFAPVQTEVLTLNRKIFDDFTKEENTLIKQQRQKALEKNFSKLRKTDNKEEFMKYFKPKDYPEGYILTTTTSGSTDLFVISKGRVLIFVPNKYLKDYPRNFLILSILEKSNTFNESFVLFDKDANFGSMILEADSEVLSIDKHNLLLVTDEDSLNCLRANYQAKERLFKTFIEKFSCLSNEEITKQQDELCKHYKLSMKNLEESFDKVTSAGKILTTSAIKDKDRNIEKFNQTFSKPIEPTGNGNIYGTNRLVPKELKGFTPQQVMAMNSLKKYAGNTTSSSNPNGLNELKGGCEINSIKNKLLNEEKGNDGNGLNKKSIGEKKNLNKAFMECEEKKVSNEKGNQFSKFQQSNEDLLKKLNVVNEDATKEKILNKEEAKPVVKIYKKIPSTDKNVIEVDNTRINLLLLEHKK